MFSFRVSYISLFILLGASWPSLSVRQATPDDQSLLETSLLDLAGQLLRGNVVSLLKIYKEKVSESESMTYSSIEGDTIKEKGKSLFDLMIEKDIIKTLVDFIPFFRSMVRFDLEYILNNQAPYKDLLDISLKKANSAILTAQETPPRSSPKDLAASISKPQKQSKEEKERFLKLATKNLENKKRIDNLNLEYDELFKEFKQINERINSLMKNCLK